MLVPVTLVAGFFFYNNIMKSVGTMTNSVQTRMETLFLETFSTNATCITFFIGNSGMWAIRIVSAFINDQIANLFQNVEIGKNLVKPVYVFGTFSKGLTYGVKLISNFGGALTFDIPYT